MKSIIRNITATAVALCTLIGTASLGHAANITLDGSGYYKFGHTVRHSTEGVSQTGRYSNLSGSYYRRAEIGMDWISNNSSKQSGKLSFELWAMPFYGSTSGIVLMTRSLGALSGGHYYETLSREGHAVFLDKYKFPEINIWEKTSNGWRFRDALSFKGKNLM